MNRKLLGTALITASSATLISGCGILESVEVPEFRFDSNSYIVQPGDTLDSVATRYEIDPDSLISVNSLQLAELVPGQRLLLLRDEEVASMASLASNNTSADALDTGVPVTGLGDTLIVPNAAQTASAGSAVVTPAKISTDVLLPVTGTEEIVGVVKVTPAGTDDLLDDQPVFLPEPELINGVQQPAVTDAQVAAVERPNGVETIVDSVNVADTVALNDRIQIPNAGTVDISDADANNPVKRITVNRHDAGWNWPAIGMITREFDLSEINRQGLDIDPGPGAGVQAAADGEVVYSGKDLASYGNLVILRHEDNFLSAYSKVSDIFVQENQTVKAGDLIASVGGDKSGSNELHFEIRRNGEPVNPIDYLPAL